MYAVVCVYAGDGGDWGDEVWVFKQNSVAASHPCPLNTKPFQMSLWRSSWMNQCLFTLILSLVFFFSSMLPLIQEIGQKVSLEAFAFSTNPQFLHDGVKEILFSSNFFDKLHFFLFRRYFQPLSILMIPFLTALQLQIFYRIIDELATSASFWRLINIGEQ